MISQCLFSDLIPDDIRLDDLILDDFILLVFVCFIPLIRGMFTFIGNTQWQRQVSLRT